MIEFWKIQVLLGNKTIEQVPSKYREQVREALKEYNF